MCGPRQRSNQSPWRVDLHVLAFRDRVDQLDLEHLALVAKHLLRALTVPDLLGEGAILRDDLVHPRFDRSEVIGRERLVAEEVVVEAVLDHRADRHLRAGEEPLHRLGEHMRAVVPDQFQRCRVVAGDDLDLSPVRDAVGKIGEHAIHPHRDRLLGERPRDRLRQGRSRRAVGKSRLAPSGREIVTMAFTCAAT